MAELNDRDVEDIRDSHKLLARVDQKLSDHLEWSTKMSEARNKEIAALDSRIKPIEDAVGSARTLLKAIAYLGGGAGAVGGVSGWAFWEHIKSFFKHLLTQ